MNMDFGLSERRVVIVGAHRGIGFALAKAFQDQGTKLVIASESPEIFQARDRLEESSNSASVEAFQFDVTDRQKVLEAFEQIGRHDVLVANAGIFTSTASTDTSDENAAKFARHLDINVVGLNNCAVAAIPHLNDNARIIFTASIWGKVGAADYTGYAASKHGVIGLMKSLAMDLGPLGITVNAVNPGSIGTEANITELSDEKKRSLTGQMCLRPGLIEPEKLVGTYLFLASDAASEITGQSISVDRGQTISGEG